MEKLFSLLGSTGLAPPLHEDKAGVVAQYLAERINSRIYPQSITGCDGRMFFLARNGSDRIVGVVRGEPSNPQIDVSPADASAARILRDELEFLRPKCFGTAGAVGTGDRLGRATPGHIRAFMDKSVACVLAQQSIREMTRTARSPQKVLDDATFGAFQEGFREGFGADADHLKTTDEIDSCLDAGFVMFTIDPGEYVDDRVDLPDTELDDKFQALPWSGLETTPADCRAAFAGRMGPGELVRAAVKYGPAVAHSVKMYRHLESRASGPFEVEVSVDETAEPTTAAEHRYIASELNRLGVEWVSLAPRFIGDFEKGVDYIGDIAAFETALAEHYAVAQELGHYKLGFHSGSDKFSIYPVAARVCGDMVHLKTAGTSYLVALSVAAELDPNFFREILALARERYPEDRASYHVSADLENVPAPDDIPDDRLPEAVKQFDTREVLHVTYGSVLERTDLAEHLAALLDDNEDIHYAALEAHIGRHIEPFI